jgi:transcriptional regulator with XRE-family HTH domain
MKPFTKIPDPRAIRERLGLNQTEFWAKVGITQSGGSRYESGRSLPRAVRELVRLVYLRDVPLAIANGTDLRIAAALRQRNPDLYKELATAVRKKD